MTRIGLRALRADLATYVRRAARGNPVTITDRGSAIAVLRAPDDTPSTRHELLLATGRLIPPRLPHAEPITTHVPTPIGLRIDRVIDEVR